MKKDLFRRMYSYTFLLLLHVCTAFSSFAQTTHWWNDAVFYEVFVRSFKDNNGDGQGDLQGLISKLDYLNDGDPSTHHDLGITALWLMPVQQSPSYHGYDVTDYRSIEQDYGTNADFTALVDAAHQRGIKVIIDYVMNHTSSQHPWFTQSTNSLNGKRDWYVWQNPAPVVTGPWGQTVWYPRNGSNYYAIFWSEMPDLNYSTPAVKTEMFDIASFWLQDMNVDGFRLDAIKYIDEDGNTLEDTPETIQFWKDFRSHYKSVKPDALAVGEAWTSTEKVAPYVEDEGVDYCFDFDLADSLIKAANTGSPACLRAQVDKVMNAYPFLQFGTFLTNHDINRVMTRLSNSIPKAKIAADLLLTLPGIPYLYYGEEIGMTGSGADENKRTPLQWNNTVQAGFSSGTPWRAVNTDYLSKNIEAQQQDPASLWTNYKKLIALRNHQVALRKGTYKTATASAASVFAFLRQYDAEHVMVVCNTAGAAANNVQLSAQAGIAPGNYVWVELLGGTSIPVMIDPSGNFSGVTITQIPGRRTFIYKLLPASATSASVTFEVDMSKLISNGSFNPATETVDIVSSFNNFGTTTTTVLNDVDGDGIFSVTIPELAIGSKVTFKYRLNGVNDGREEFPTTVYVREYFVPEGSTTVKDEYQQQTITGIKNMLQQAMAIYPIPANEQLILSFSDALSGSIDYELTDVLGNVKKAGSFVASAQSDQYIIGCEQQLSGIYVLTLNYQGVKESFKVAIQR